MKSRRAINFFTATFLSIRVRYVYLCVDNCFSRKKKLERCENRKRIISLGKLRRDRSVVSIKFSLEFQRPGDREIEVGRCWPRVKESLPSIGEEDLFSPDRPPRELYWYSSLVGWKQETSCSFASFFWFSSSVRTNSKSRQNFRSFFNSFQFFLSLDCYKITWIWNYR